MTKMNAERLFKVLNQDGTAYHGGSLTWSLPNGQHPGAWHEVRGQLVPCNCGLHLCRAQDLASWLGPALYLAEYKGERVNADNTVVVRRARLVAKVETWTERNARLFAVVCARRALDRERTAGREPDARSWAALDVATAFAEGQSDWKALAAAEAAAVAAAEAATGAERGVAAAAAAEVATGAVGGAAARAAAWAATWAAAGAATAWAAAWAAERQWQTDRLMAMLFPEN